jgi:hypothetical protein
MSKKTPKPKPPVKQPTKDLRISAVSKRPFAMKAAAKKVAPAKKASSAKKAVR